MTLDFIFKQATGQTAQYWLERGDLDWYDRWADKRKGTPSKGVLTANWNNFPESTNGLQYGTPEYDRVIKNHRRFERILKQAGYETHWSDQTSRCEHCSGCISEGPDYYGDTAHYTLLGECDIVCEDCIRESFQEEYLEGLEDNPHAAVAISGIDPAKHGYKPIAKGFESGFHPGQTDDPRKIMKALQKQGYTGVLFNVDGSGQFDVAFSVFAKGLPKMVDWQWELAEVYEGI